MENWKRVAVLGYHKSGGEWQRENKEEEGWRRSVSHHIKASCPSMENMQATGVRQWQNARVG